MQSDAHLDGARGKRIGESRCRSQGSGGAWEGEEEGISLGVDLDSAFRGTGLANQAPVVGQDGGIALCTELVQEPRRALDVGEEKRDRAGRELGPHARSIAFMRRHSKRGIPNDALI
jgi:hypothetical protein